MPLLVRLCLVLFVVLPIISMAQQSHPLQTSQQVYDAYLPIDHWAYDALDRLHAMGYLDHSFTNLRPWTRRSIGKMLQAVKEDELIENDPQAMELLAALLREFPASDQEGPLLGAVHAKPESVYVRLQGINGQTLRDSWHLGQSFKNDYARPYQPGFNAIEGQSAMAQAGRFSLYARGEFQHAPAAAGYSNALAQLISKQDVIPYASNPRQATIPEGPLKEVNHFRLIEANLSFRALNHQISFGKTDHWLSTAKGGSFAYSNNAENIYAFSVDRTEPLYIPYLSRLTGSVRYQFMIGSLKGQTAPNSPYFHLEKFSFQPYRDLQIGFSRTMIWGGRGHAPVTLHTFLKGFFHISSVTAAEKHSRDDPGARFSMFDLTWRIPFYRYWATFYVDGIVHDDVSPISAPRHAGVRPGIYLSRIPHANRLDFRVEGWNTDPQVRRSISGNYLYSEEIYRQAYTNQGFVIGDFAGRESKGGEAWLTFHRTPRENITANYRYTKAAKDFVLGGTTQHVVRAEWTRPFLKDLELNIAFQREQWKAPIYLSGQQSNTSVTGTIRWYPKKP